MDGLRFMDALHCSTTEKLSEMWNENHANYSKKQILRACYSYIEVKCESINISINPAETPIDYNKACRKVPVECN